MTTAWGADLREAPRTAWLLARDAAAGRGPAAVSLIPCGARPGVIVALGAQVRAFRAQAALQGVTWEPRLDDLLAGAPCRPVRDLAAAALSGQTVRVPGDPCQACTAAAAARMAAALAEVMAAAGIRRRDVPLVLGWLAANAR